MRRLLAVVALAAVAACANPRPALEQSRLTKLAEAFQARASDPARAVEAFAAAGPGPVLERVREQAWLQELEAFPAPPSAWRRFLDARPPAALEIRARVGLARALVARGQKAAAMAVLEAASGDGRIEADAALVEVAEGGDRLAAARRLAVAAPPALHHLAPDLEGQVVSSLTAGERLQRSRRWRDAALPERSLAELRRLRFRGDDERLRRLEVARSEIATGAPRRALRALPSSSGKDPEALLVRAAALRSLGWQQVPGTAARRAFRDCLATARAAAAATGEATALELVLECGTEAGGLEEALAAWRRLEAGEWNGDRREWLGRRLGVALARAGRKLDAVADLAAAMPMQRRCLEFWSAVAAGEGSRDGLRRLSGVPFADLYGLWARRVVGMADPSVVHLEPARALAPQPAGVSWLLDRDAAAEAADQWRWIGQVRGVLPGEGLPASELAASLGRQKEAIWWLLEAFPELGTVAMGRVPENVVRAYLPLRWRSAVVAAATENGIDPWLLAAVARQESTFAPHARSPRGALGLLQLVPGTARRHAIALGLGRSPDLLDPETNLRLGARELSHLLTRFGAVEPALAAYNAGEARVAAWWRAWPGRERFTEAIPIPESYNYVRRVTYLAEAYRLVYEQEWRTGP